MKTISLASIQEPVQRELEAVTRRLAALSESETGLIRQVGEHVLNGGGKRLRPTLVLLMAQMGGKNLDLAELAATVVELVHTATLIHDDTVDGSSLRRGKPTVNRQFNHSISIIMGDFVYSKAFALLAERQLYPLIEILAHATHQMSRGEMIEMDLKYKVETAEEEYLDMIDGKTAVLFQAACEIGAYLGFEGGRREEAREFGRSLGLAFQISDDLMDLTGEEEVIGKDRGNDLKEGKVTLPYIAALRNSPAGERERYSELIAHPENIEGQWEDMLQWVRRRGGESYARDRSLSYARRATELLSGFPETDASRALADAAAYVVDRPL